MQRKTMIRTAFILLTVGLFISVCLAEEPTQDQKANTQKFRDSYSLGYEFGASLRSRGVDGDIDKDVLVSALRQALEGRQPELSPEKIRETLNQLKKKVMVWQDLQFRELAAKNLEQSRAFMEINKSKEGVKTLPSGLQYKTIIEGKGLSPKSSDIVKVAYRGTLVDGTEFDTSSGPDGPIVSRVDGLIKGWAEALPLMKVGSKWQLFLPPSLGYGERPFRRVPPNSVLAYEVELLSIEDGTRISMTPAERRESETDDISPVSQESAVTGNQ